MDKIKGFFASSFTVCVLLVILLTEQVFAYKLTDFVTGDCGSEVTSVNYTLNYTVGEEAIKVFSGTGYALQSGFWYVVAVGTGPDTVPPSIPVLVSPLDNSWTTNQMVSFTWEKSIDSSGISKYEFRVSVNSDFLPLTTYYDVISTYTSTFLNYGQYYWSVRAFDNNNNSSLWASPWSILVSSRVWRLYVTAESDELVADNEQGIYVYANFVEPAGSTEPLSGYNYPVSLKIRCGQTVRTSSGVVSEDGTAVYYYRDNIAGEMTVEAEYDSVVGNKIIHNLVPLDKGTTVWCAADGGLTQVICPANTFSGNVWVDITILQEEIILPEWNAVKYLPNSGREVTASMEGQPLTENDFNENLTLIIPYDAQYGIVEGIEIDEAILNICRLKDGSAVQMLGTVDEENNKVRGTLGYLSTYFIGFFLPTKPKLYPNFPNPFRLGDESTCIMYDLVKPSKVKVRIYNLSGELIRILKKTDEEESGGQYKVYWDGKNESGMYVAQGIYVCVLETSEYQNTVKIAVLRKKQEQ